LKIVRHNTGECFRWVDFQEHYSQMESHTTHFGYSFGAFQQATLIVS